MDDALLDMVGNVTELEDGCDLKDAGSENFGSPNVGFRCCADLVIP